jgi:hypothetical protein
MVRRVLAVLLVLPPWVARPAPARWTPWGRSAGHRDGKRRGSPGPRPRVLAVRGAHPERGRDRYDAALVGAPKASRLGIADGARGGAGLAALEAQVAAAALRDWPTTRRSTSRGRGRRKAHLRWRGPRCTRVSSSAPGREARRPGPNRPPRGTAAARPDHQCRSPCHPESHPHVPARPRGRSGADQTCFRERGALAPWRG